MHPLLRYSMQFLYMKDDVGYEEFLATKRELESLNKQWKRSLVVTKLTMKEA